MFFAIIMSLVVGFVYSVILTLLLMGLFTAVIISGFLQLRLLSIRAYKDTQASDEAGKVNEKLILISHKVVVAIFA